MVSAGGIRVTARDGQVIGDQAAGTAYYNLDPTYTAAAAGQAATITWAETCLPADLC